MAPIVFVAIAGWQSVMLCLLFACIYVGSLYIWTDALHKNRDDPVTIKRRFMSVGVISVIIPLLLRCFGTYSENEEAHDLVVWLGIRFHGFLPALLFPLVLTMVLFLGPLGLHYMDGVFRIYLEPRYWTNSLKNLTWIRNHIVAPFSEEFIFRACMLPLLVPSFGEGYSVFICPLFFGVAHIHHMIDRVIQGHQPVGDAVKQTVFQMFYTTMFGAYSAFLFLRTGHLIAPVIAHAFCNHMGFPSFKEALSYPKPTRSKLVACFVAGLLSWIALVFPVTSPFLYANDVYNL
ncbi:CAAX prenyl protease 2-like [Pecten maximus]|uniref:CAAX prenyl protease 2-like n=1 Tax=Pecten maximus TaxID=6579 RepID=UPI001458679E|nr:CAAX prenyl protease 2-like [Pecten maximus]